MSPTGVGWRAPIFHCFGEDIARDVKVTIVKDPDELFSDADLLEHLDRNGFEILEFEDPVAFRFIYETRYRAQPVRARSLIIKVTAADEETLPYDVIQESTRTGRILQFSVAQLFPRLAPIVVAQIGRERFDALFSAQQEQPETLGENATCDFVLRRVFKVVPDQLREPADLLATLCRRHYRRERWSPLVDEYFIDMLKRRTVFRDWPLGRIVPSREDFLAFLQERWPVFLKKRIADRNGQEIAAENIMTDRRYEGPALLPFESEDVRVFVDTFFIEGLLAPVEDVPKSAFSKGDWASVGVSGSDESSLRHRFEKLSRALAKEIPNKMSSASEWLAFAGRWAELSALRFQVPGEAGEKPVEERTVESRFAEWMLERYPLLHSLPHWPKPMVVHKIPHFLAHELESRPQAAKVALVVVDGLSLRQWAPLRDSLAGQNRNWLIEENYLFAWVPTLTSVSRQAIFAGRPPMLFEGSLDTTGREERHWRQFWNDQGLEDREVAYLCQKLNEADEAFLERLRDAVSDRRRRVLGIVVGRLDEILHGTVTGEAGLQSQTAFWAGQGHFTRLVETLVDADFQVRVTADHGNTGAGGVGRPDVGVTAQERGERVLVFSDQALMKRTLAEHPEAIVWNNVGLPRNYHVVLARAGEAFIKEGQQTVTHGGTSLGEMVVPFMRICLPRLEE